MKYTLDVSRPIENIILYYIQNGFYIPFIHLLLYFVTNNMFLSTAIALKLYPANYYYWFEEHYHYMPRKLNWIKQFVRFTDSGHIASFIYLIYPHFFPIAYNVHFTITVGYWLGKLSMYHADKDIIFLPELNNTFQTLWSGMIHSIPLSLFIYHLVNKNECYNYFTWEDLKWSYCWLYIWFFCIYLSWRLATGDCVYYILDNDVPMKKKVLAIVFINGIMCIGNMSGYLLAL